MKKLFIILISLLLLVSCEDEKPEVELLNRMDALAKKVFEIEIKIKKKEDITAEALDSLDTEIADIAKILVDKDANLEDEQKKLLQDEFDKIKNTYKFF